MTHAADESVPFEVPMLKDFRFRGREAVLAAMDQFFSHPPAEASTPLVYVVSGLGEPHCGTLSIICIN